MNILVISPGKKHDATVELGIAEYQKRLSKHFVVEWATPAAESIEKESVAILKLIKDTDRVVLLDEKGKDIDTPGFAAMLENALHASVKRLVFVIGGAYGVGEEVKKRADVTHKLSSLVFPHMMVRLILIEQLYRAQSIREGGKYHHA